MDNETNQQVTTHTPPEITQPLYKRPWFFGLVAIAVLLLIGAVIASLFKTPRSNNTATTSAADTFYTMLETAAQKTKVHFLYETKRAASGTTNSLYVRSLAEFDTAKKEYSSVFVSETLLVNAGRCVKNQEYTFKGRFALATLPEAEASLKTQWSPQSRAPIGICNYLNGRYHGSITDSILPVGITAAQAKGMVDGLKQQNAIDYKNEGTVTYNGKQASKISIEVSKQKSGKSNATAALFFFAFRDGTTTKVGTNFNDLANLRAHFEDRLYQTGPTPELKGYYLIDQQTKLPLYSEFLTIGDKVVPTTYSSVYAFPETLTITKDTPLPEITKP